MAYLEELLPEFRKGARIRISTWPKNQYIYKKGNETYNEDGEISKFLDGYVMTCDLWEFYQGPIDWNHIIMNKCLCRFWDKDSDDFGIGILDEIKENVSFKYLLLGGDYFQNCRPVRRDEVNFYDE